MNINILSSASQDLIDGYHFYEDQKEELGNYFLDSLYSDIDSLMINAGVHEVHFDSYYRLLSKRFPFAVYYQIHNQDINIYAVLDCRKKPAWVREQLSN